MQLKLIRRKQVKEVNHTSSNNKKLNIKSNLSSDSENIAVYTILNRITKSAISYLFIFIYFS